MSLNYVSLVLDFYDGQGNPVTTGSVTLSPNATVLDATDHIVVTRKPVVVNLFGNPAPTVSLAATDNADLQPSGWGWLIQPQFPGAPDGQVYELLFTGGATQFMSGLIPATEGPVITTYATAAGLAAETARAEAAEAGFVSAASPAFTGTPTAPTASALTSTTQLATTAYADSATAVEKSRAQTAEALLAPKASPALTGTPTAPTATALTASTQLATTAYADSAVSVAKAAAIAASLPTLATAAASSSATLAVNTLTQVTAASNLTMTLPSPVQGALIVVERETASAGTVTVSGSIRGSASTVVLQLASESEMFLGTSSTWDPVAGHKTLGSLDGRYPAAISSDAYARTEVMATPAGAGLRDYISARDAPFSAKFDGTTDDFAALNSAQQASSTLHLPDGTAIVGTAITWNQSKVTIRGEGMYSTTVRSTGGLLGILKQVPTGTGFASEVEISDLTLDCSGSSGSSYGIQANGSAITRLTVRRVRFINCAASMITGGYAANYIIEDCVGDGAGNGSTGGTFANLAALPMESLIIRRNKIRWANQGVVVGSSGFHSAYVEIADNDIDLGWWLIKSAFTGSGGTVTYTSGGLTDSAAAFSGIATNTTVRVMPVRQTGTLTSGSSGTFITDSAATFTTNAVKRGEIVRCGTAFAVVSKVVAQTKLHVEEWLDQATYQPVVPPSIGSSYTVYGIILGNITASTGTTLTVSHGAGHGGSAWYDLTGTELTPASGTLYEVLTGHPSYPVYCDTVTDKLQITGNRIRRGWSDGIECFGSKAIITGNIVEDGQDEGIVVQGATGGLVANNLCKHNGTSGLDVVGSDVNIEVGPNLYQDNGWGAPASVVLGQVTISASTGVTMTGGKAYSTGEATPQYGLVLSGALSGVKVSGFTGISSAVADVYVASTVSAGACQLLDVTGVIAYQGTTNGQFLRVAGTGAPSLIASPGSQFLRTDGSTGTILYVKETGNGSTGWTPYTAGGGFTSPMTTVGDIIYEGTGPAAAALAGNTTATKNFLTQTGTGSASAAPAWAALGAADMPAISVQSVTATGSYTWNKPAGAQTVDVILCSGGTGGGAGAVAITANAGGGGGGGGGGVLMRTFVAADLASSVTGTVGAGGNGGTAASGTTAASGGNGSVGGTTTFGSDAAAAAGTASQGGSSAGGNAGPAGAGNGASGAGGAGGAAAAGASSATAAGPSGGGGGGGANSGSVFNGGVGQLSLMGSTTNTGTAGVAGGASPGTGTQPSIKGTTSCGGGGGGSVNTGGSTAQAGATAFYGGGGGGGGAAFYPGSGGAVTSGAGGKGGDGFALIITHFA